MAYYNQQREDKLNKEINDLNNAFLELDNNDTDVRIMQLNRDDSKKLMKYLLFIEQKDKLESQVKSCKKIFEEKKEPFYWYWYMLKNTYSLGDNFFNLKKLISAPFFLYIIVFLACIVVGITMSIKNGVDPSYKQVISNSFINLLLNIALIPARYLWRFFLQAEISEYLNNVETGGSFIFAHIINLLFLTLVFTIAILIISAVFSVLLKPITWKNKRKNEIIKAFGTQKLNEWKLSKEYYEDIRKISNMEECYRYYLNMIKERNPFSWKYEKYNNPKKIKKLIEILENKNNYCSYIDSACKKLEDEEKEEKNINRALESAKEQTGISFSNYRGLDNHYCGWCGTNRNMQLYSKLPGAVIIAPLFSVWPVGDHRDYLWICPKCGYWSFNQ